MRKIKETVSFIVVIFLFGAMAGGGLVFYCEWGAYSDLLAKASEASKEGKGLVLYDLSEDTEVPRIVNGIALARMADLKLREIQDLELACQDIWEEQNDTAIRDNLIPDGEYPNIDTALKE